MNNQMDFVLPTLYDKFLLENRRGWRIYNRGYRYHFIFNGGFGRKKYYLSDRRMGAGFFYDWTGR